jgi:hypothetical protein
VTLERNDDRRLAEEDTELTDREIRDIDRDDLDADEAEEIEVAEIRADIEETRVEMGGTLRELGDRLEPGRLMNEAKENVREATIGRVEETAKGMSEMVMETIKRNPIPAAMAGAGLALLWMNRSNDGNGNGYASGLRHGSSTQYGGMYGTTSSYGQSSGGERGLTDRAGEVASGVGENVGNVVGQAGETIGQVGQNVGQTVGQGVQHAGWRLERFMQSSPLAVGVVALGAGAVVGAIVPETEAEQNVLGEASRNVGETVRQAVNEATTEAERQIDRVEQEQAAGA